MEQGQWPLCSYMGPSREIIVTQCRGFLGLSMYIAKMLSKNFLQFTFPMSPTNFKLYSVTSYSTEIRPWLWCRYGLLPQDSGTRDTVFGIMVLEWRDL